jgi:SynChlorMet cassette radical SAM/SPASM protein ScmE
MRDEEHIRVMKTPKTVDIDVTHRCNLRCAYCYYFTGAAEVSADLPVEEWLTFFDELGECAVMRVALAGGEPFIREDLRILIERIVRNRMRFSILSNGTLITDDMAAFLRSTNRCDLVQVSIDGPGPETHDVFRGDGSFARALAGLRTLLRNGVPATVRVTIHRHNVHSMVKVAELLLEDVGLPAFSTNSASYMGLCQKNQDMVQLSVEDQSVAMQALLDLKQKYGDRVNAQAGPLANARQWLEMEQARNAGEAALPGCGYLRSCGGVMSKLNVRADGVMTPCNQLSHVELGRINRDKVREVWLNHPELQRLRRRRNTPLDDLAFCKGCEYIPYCRGGCPALAYAITGSDGAPAPDSCLRDYLAAGGVLPEGECLACGCE